MKHTSKKIVKEYYEELCNLKFDNNLNEMDKFLEKHNLPKLTEEVNRPESITEIEPINN